MCEIVLYGCVFVVSMCLCVSEGSEKHTSVTNLCDSLTRYIHVHISLVEGLLLCVFYLYSFVCRCRHVCEFKKNDLVFVSCV